jgi:dipeptidyl aminopeptidase/acylaminoacyl peptidase
MHYHRHMRRFDVHSQHRITTPAAAALLCAAMLIPAPALANGYEDYPARIAWAPDSGRLAVAAPDESASADGSVYVYDRELKSAEFVLTTWGSAALAFSPDGRTLAIAENGYVSLAHLAGPQGIWTVPMTLVPVPALDLCWAPPCHSGSGPSLLISAGERFYGSQVWRVDPWLWTTDLFAAAGPGNSLCMPQCDAEGRRAWLLRQDGFEGAESYERLSFVPLTAEGHTSPVRATVRQDSDYHESNHSVRGDFVFFQRGGWGQWSILALEIDTGLENLIVEGGAQPSLDAGGRWLAYLLPSPDSLAKAENAWEADRDVWVLDQRTGESARLAVAPRGATSLALSPDGSSVAWLEYDPDGKMAPRAAENPLLGKK